MADDPNLTYTVHVIKRMDLQAGDLLVLTTPVFLTDEMVANLTERMRGILPTGVRVAVMDGGLSIDGIVGERDGREL